MNTRLAFALLVSTFAATTSASAQHLFSFGLKGGFPFTYSTSTTNAVEVKYDSSSRNFIGGVTGEINLPLGLSVEADALYHPYNLRTTGFTLPPTTIHNYTLFEIPVVGKLRLGRGFAKPYVEAGPEFRTTPGNLTLSHDGFVVGGGIEFKLAFLKVSPEVRYVRWANSTFAAANPNQLAALLGISF